MKKLVSVALVAALTLGSMNMQAGNGAKKAWAYTKIVYGGCFLALGIACPFLHTGVNLSPEAFQGEDFEILKKTPFKDVWGTSLFIYLPLGILSIKSGKEDLKKLKKKLKKNAQKAEMLLA